MCSRAVLVRRIVGGSIRSKFEVAFHHINRHFEAGTLIAASCIVGEEKAPPLFTAGFKAKPDEVVPEPSVLSLWRPSAVRNNGDMNLEQDELNDQEGHLGHTLG